MLEIIACPLANASVKRIGWIQVTLVRVYVKETFPVLFFFNLFSSFQIANNRSIIQNIAFPKKTKRKSASSSDNWIVYVFVKGYCWSLVEPALIQYGDSSENCFENLRKTSRLPRADKMCTLMSQFYGYTCEFDAGSSLSSCFYN